MCLERWQHDDLTERNAYSDGCENAGVRPGMMRLGLNLSIRTSLDGSMDSLRDGTDCLRSEARRDGGSERFGIMLGSWVLRAVKAEVS